MSDKMTPIPFSDIMNTILTEREKHGSVFGVEQFYSAQSNKFLPMFNERMETPFGPAAGPNTQLAQNIIAAYYTGARFFELKTVQIMDGEELSKCVPKPCILAGDEGYNCEWSTELTVQEALEEYVKAWFACKLLAREYGLGDENGFIFNMSVGYDYDGITSKKIDDFIEGLKDASKLPIFSECRNWAINNLNAFKNVNKNYVDGISKKICGSITLSTLHGCPPGEIERIAAYLLETKKLHTFVKCNPTILGYETARRILDGLGYDYIAFDDHHFKEDLQYSDAVPMFKRLSNIAKKNNLEFGLKLSNTFPVDVKANELPSKEMYMSGRSLYPLTIEMANRFTQEFDGRLRISYSGGADAYNIKRLYSAGIWPITVATTILKPGGYTRLHQLAGEFRDVAFTPFEGVSVARVKTLAQVALNDPHHEKPIKPLPDRKMHEQLPIINCFEAPCKHGCPINQDVPEYVSLVGQGKHLDAMRVITEKNPLPYITSKICPHTCADKCVRNYYDESIKIRNAKFEAVRNSLEAYIGNVETPVITQKKRAAIIGGGPAGLATAYFLCRAGMPVTIFEKRESLGGIVRHVIPEFRISDHAIDRDVQLVEKMGARFKLNTEAPTIDELRSKGYDFVIVATGAWAPGELALESGKTLNVLEFLESCKNGSIGDVGENICIAGGGNTAMDAARAAKRLPNAKTVSIVYRRTKKYMPADEEELHFCINEGIQFLELLAPVSLENGTLTCEQMELGAPDSSGRRSPVPTGKIVDIPCDTLISAVGEKVESGFFTQNGITLNKRGMPEFDAQTQATNIAGVYVIGDAAGGPSTVVKAIAAAQRAADDILGDKYEYTLPDNAYSSANNCRAKQGVMREYSNAPHESSRCLNCNTSCELCVQVCPNRANIALSVPGLDMRQILHIDRMCNECGNCAIFCPYDDRPYKSKLTLFHTEEEFNASDNHGFLQLDGTKYRARIFGEVSEVDTDLGESELAPAVEAVLNTLNNEYGYLL